MSGWIPKTVVPYNTYTIPNYVANQDTYYQSTSTYKNTIATKNLRRDPPTRTVKDAAGINVRTIKVGH